MKFNEWLKSEREKRAMTQQTFAIFVGLSVPVIRAFEKGEKTPSPASIHLLAGALKTPIKKITEMIKNQKEGV